MDKVVERIAIRMEMLGLNEPETCRRAGLASTFIRDIREKRKTTLTYKAVRALADVLKVTPEWIMEGRQSDSGIASDPDGAEIIALWDSQFDANAKRQLLKVARSFAEPDATDAKATSKK